MLAKCKLMQQIISFVKHWEGGIHFLTSAVCLPWKANGNLSNHIYNVTIITNRCLSRWCHSLWPLSLKLWNASNPLIYISRQISKNIDLISQHFGYRKKCRNSQCLTWIRSYFHFAMVWCWKTAMYIDCDLSNARAQVPQTVNALHFLERVI